MRLSLRSLLTATLLLPLIIGCSDKDLEQSRKETEEVIKQKETEEKEKPSEKEEEKEKEKEETPKKEKDDEKKSEEEKKEEPKDEPKKEKEEQGEKPQTPKDEEKDKPKKETEAEDKPNEEVGEEQIAYAEPAKRSPIFLLEFTGQKCQYCPIQSRIVSASQKKYGEDKYLYAAMHSEKKFSLLNERFVSLYNEEAFQYSKEIKKPKGLPYLHYNSLGVMPSDLTVKQMFKEPDLLDCQGQAKIIAEDEIQISLETFLRRDRKDFVKDKPIDILLWILENDIVAYQQDSGQKPFHSYPKHKHIFRSSLNGHWGEVFKVGKTYKKTFKVPKNVAKIKNCEIIVLFLEHSTKMVLDAQSIKVK